MTEHNTTSEAGAADTNGLSVKATRKPQRTLIWNDALVVVDIDVDYYPGWAVVYRGKL